MITKGFLALFLNLDLRKAVSERRFMAKNVEMTVKQADGSYETIYP